MYRMILLTYFFFKLLLYAKYDFNSLSKCFSCIYNTADLHITARISNKCYNIWESFTDIEL